MRSEVWETRDIGQAENGDGGQQPAGGVGGYKPTAAKPKRASENWNGSGLWRFFLMLGDDFS
ncbi:MAG: hypothetical protein OXN25_08650 [Candidatus Poribacteria bacterium]|nr:hypothetical protein [Candidatus Poribacteria bacterium]